MLMNLDDVSLQNYIQGKCDLVMCIEYCDIMLYY